MALTYLGNCEWEPASEPEPSTPLKGLPTIREPWIGRSDKTAEFRADKAVGSQHLGGYILDNTPRENSPFFGVATVELLIATPPDFQAFEISNTLRQATATKSATVNNSQIIEGASEVAATREVAFDSPGTRYTYFTSSKPNGPRFTQAATDQMPRMRRSAVRASANNEERTYTGLSAPGALVSALTMPVADVLSDHQAEEIVGTPWFRCTDVISREFVGD